LITVDRLFQELQRRIDKESARRLAAIEAGAAPPKQRGATWTYLTTDQPFGSVSDRLIRGAMQKLRVKTF
jgi:hypothetical protein